MRFLRHPLVLVAPGAIALVLAIAALARDDGDGDGAATRPATATTAASGDPDDRALGFAELYDRADGVVARLDARRGPQDPPFGNGRRVATGAAFVVDGDGHLVTNAHVVDRARSATVRFGRSSARVPARIVGSDRSTDLAVLRVDPERIPGDDRPLELADAGDVDVGDPVLAMGTPYRLQSSASAGIVSATGREITGLTGFAIPDTVQTDAAVNPGNSGGPLLDADGRVVGVNTQGRAAGVSFAVSATTVRRVVPQLIRDGRARTAYLGVGIGEVGPRGARVTSVRDGSPASRGGIRDGDVIARIGERRTTTEGSVASAVAAGRPGQRVTVVVRRDGGERRVPVRLGTQPRG